MPNIKAPDFIGNVSVGKYWSILKSQYGLPERSDIDYYHKFYRFGVLDPYNEPQSGKEFIFFVKPDLCILDPKSGKLISELEDNPFFIELYDKWREVIYQLQYQADPHKCPFSFLMSNMVVSSLDLPSLSAQTVQNPTNMFGTSYDYRWTSEPSDDNHSFSLEFKDTANIDMYMMFRAYEEYERLKARGVIKLYKHESYKKYTMEKTLHDQFGIYKIIVKEDMETILYYAYFCGTYFASLPRDSFNDSNFDEGIKYGIDMKTAFVDDMDPTIIRDFNNLASAYATKKNRKEESYVYDFENHKTNLVPVACPIITEVAAIPGVKNSRKEYKLKFYALDEELSSLNKL